MNRPYRGPRSYLFTVRVWREELGNGESEWRGKVQRVSSGEVGYFHEWAALLSLLLEMLSETRSEEETEL